MTMRGPSKKPPIEEAPPAPFPRRLAPELATLVGSAPTGDAWLHETKYDGYRILAHREGGEVRLFSRNGKDWTARFPGVADAVRKLGSGDLILDGEVVALDPGGRSSFQGLQGAIHAGGAGRLTYFVFDLPYADGRDLTRLPLESRKEALAVLLAGVAGGGAVRYSDHVVGRGPEFHREACRHGLEGIVSKRRDSPYQSGRGQDWIKVKCLNRQEFVIGGYTDPKGSRSGLGALLVGVHDDGGRLVYSGKVGTGFDTRTLREVKGRLARLERDSPPFDRIPREVRNSHWVRPDLVAEVAFTEWTQDGILRHPSFQGIREDKKASEVTREKPSSGRDGPSSGVVRERPLGGGARNRPREAKGRDPGERPEKREEEPMDPGGGEGGIVIHGVRISHPERVLYPEQGVTKGDLAGYYETVAGRMLPHVVGRPLVLVRCPQGRHRQCFYQKHFVSAVPEQAVAVRIREAGGKAAPYLVIRDLPGLLALVQLGVLEVHAWGARVDEVEKPDLLIFDLDPGPRLEWKKIVRAARDMRERLDRLGLPSFVKTTGGKGLHLVTPLVRRAGWDEVRGFARGLAARMAADDPDAYTATVSMKTRSGRVYLDALRNGRGATAVVAWSTRSRPGAPVSAPVRWEELDSIRPDGITIGNIKERLRRKDPWEDFEAARTALTRKMLAAVETRTGAAPRIPTRRRTSRARSARRPGEEPRPRPA